MYTSRELNLKDGFMKKTFFTCSPQCAARLVVFSVPGDEVGDFIAESLVFFTNKIILIYGTREGYFHARREIVLLTGNGGMKRGAGRKD
jgi:hypothetical protein